MTEAYYVIRVIEIEDDSSKYLFNKRTLVEDVSLARKFNNLTPAKQFFSHSNFRGMRSSIDLIKQEEPPIDRNNLGAIVE